MISQNTKPDTGVAKVLIAEKSLFKALHQEMPEIKLDKTCVNEATICFGVNKNNKIAAGI